MKDLKMDILISNLTLKIYLYKENKMKVEIEDIKDNEFKPFRIILDIESIQELRELFCRFVLNVDDLKDTIEREGYDKPKDIFLFGEDEGSFLLYDILYSKLMEYEQ